MSTPRPIRRLLIANRGEIACRVNRTAQSLGLETVAVYSDADAHALHVESASHAVRIGEPSPASSYLDIDRIIDAARRTGCDAVHPGYGFLSENPAFARACEAAGIIFVGPSAHAIELMGDKARAKRAMLEAGVPCIPGYQGEDQADATLIREARAIGFPLMIKAAAGGGGRGMRLVTEAGALERSLETARTESRNAFGADELILERAIVRARHVEVQVFGDEHGNLVYLGERDCSVQRRHQKVIEEAPCPVLTPKRRAAMGEAAVAAARSVEYVGAGTVEFLLGEDGEFYFLEMNTRLQVEHPVTELVTGLDLVALQLKVAAGEPLGFSQKDVTLQGHAIEVRLYAEDPGNEFLPSTGVVDRFIVPSGPGVRVDTGIRDGSEVSPYYDPMVAKVIASGASREISLKRLIRALSGSALFGPATNRDFLIDALKRDRFANGEANTSFIEAEYGDEGFAAAPTRRELALAAVIQTKLRTERARAEAVGVDDELINWSSGVPLESVTVYAVDEQPVPFLVRPMGPRTYAVSAGGDFTLTCELPAFDAATAVLALDTERHTVAYHASPDGKHLSLAVDSMQFAVTDVAGGDAEADSGGSGRIVSPMHGLLLELLVTPGETVCQGQRLAVLEAMKMQHELVADIDGTVVAVHAEKDTQLAMGTLILEIDPAAA